MLLAWLGTGPLAYGDENPVVSDKDVQRGVIEEARRIQTLRLDALEQDCASKFAVTRCLDQVHAGRLAVESKLKRQETLLNDAQRQERGREQRERNREKAAAHAEKLANLANLANLENLENAPAVQIRQPKLAAQPLAQATSRQPVSSAHEPSLSVSERSAHAKDYQRKQADVIARRAAVAKRLKDAGTKKTPLPKPE